MDGSDPTERSRHQWSAVSAAWESNRRRLFELVRPVSERLVEQVGARPGATLLELTAGPGETGFLAAARLGPDGLLISSDFVRRWSTPHAAAARRSASTTSSTGCSTRRRSTCPTTASTACCRGSG